jgi:hypothetical protein
MSAFHAALGNYFLFGVGYIAYTTLVVALNGVARGVRPRCRADVGNAQRDDEHGQKLNKRNTNGLAVKFSCRSYPLD